MTELLKITGEVTNSREISYDDLAGINASHQVIDVSKLGMKRGGDAITLGGLLELVQVQETAQYIGLHASADNFHASIPLAPIRDTALLIYRLHDAPLTGKSGGPFRFYIPNHAAAIRTKLMSVPTSSSLTTSNLRQTKDSIIARQTMQRTKPCIDTTATTEPGRPSAIRSAGLGRGGVADYPSAPQRHCLRACCQPKANGRTST